MFFIVFGICSLAGAKSEFTDTLYFSGMLTYKIVEASNQELSDYRFNNGKNALRIEGRKYLRAYILKEGPIQTRDLHISYNYSNAVMGVGGTVLFEGEC